MKTTDYTKLSEEELQALVASASTEALAVKFKMDAHRAKRMAEVDAEINQMFGAEWQEASKRHTEVSNALIIVRDAKFVKSTIKSLPVPEGTILEEWEYQRWGPAPWKKTGVRGVVEVLRRETIKDLDLRYKTVGDIVIRLLKKDGTPSRRLARGYHHDLPSDQWRIAEEVKKEEVAV